MADTYRGYSRMLTHPALIQWAQQFSLRTWAVVVSLSSVLAFSSALVLAVSFGVALPEPLAAGYKRVELFVRDTIRLTFKPHKPNQMASDTVYMAPPGILEEKRGFVWLEAGVQASAPQVAALTDVHKAKAPLRLLDPNWQPEFKGN